MARENEFKNKRLSSENIDCDDEISKQAHIQRNALHFTLSTKWSEMKIYDFSLLAVEKVTPLDGCNFKQI